MVSAETSRRLLVLWLSVNLCAGSLCVLVCIVPETPASDAQAPCHAPTKAPEPDPLPSDSQMPCTHCEQDMQIGKKAGFRPPLLMSPVGVILSTASLPAPLFHEFRELRSDLDRVSPSRVVSVLRI